MLSVPMPVLVTESLFLPIYDQTVTYFIDQSMQAINNSLLWVAPMKISLKTKNRADSGAEMIRQFKENK